MGNQLCDATVQTPFKARIMEICNGVQNYQGKVKLEPITFSDHGSPREQVYRDDEIKENSVDNFSSTKLQFQPMLKNQRDVTSFNPDPINQQIDPNRNQKTSSYSNQHLTQSPTRKAKINFDQVYLKHVNSNHEQGNLNYQPMTVPFAVIKMVLNKRLVPFIEDEKHSFFKKYQNDLSSFKLYKEGCYGHLLSNNSGIFLNKDYFYEGSFILNDKGQFLPSQQGTYITLIGKYIGQFNDGKPQGNGKYVAFQGDDFSKGTTYLGHWQNGNLLKGTIENHLFKYQGQLNKKKPHGQGKLYFKVSKSSYQGQFKDGKFHGQRAFYETSEYTYSGDFNNGKKHGRGVLSQKSSALQNFSRKTRKQERYEGNWKQDKLQQRVIVSTNNA